MFLIFLSKPLQCKFVIQKINLIVFINASFLRKKSKILTSIPQTLVIYHTKNLCHHIKHILFYLWLKYGEIGTNIASLIEFFSIKNVQWDAAPSTLLERLECESKSKNNRRKRSWGTPPSL
jgi:hypothetical protein